MAMHAFAAPERACAPVQLGRVRGLWASIGRAPPPSAPNIARAAFERRGEREQGHKFEVDGTSFSLLMASRPTYSIYLHHTLLSSNEERRDKAISNVQLAMRMASEDVNACEISRVLPRLRQRRLRVGIWIPPWIPVGMCVASRASSRGAFLTRSQWSFEALVLGVPTATHLLPTRPLRCSDCVLDVEWEYMIGRVSSLGDSRTCEIAFYLVTDIHIDYSDDHNPAHTSSYFLPDPLVMRQPNAYLPKLRKICGTYSL
ncbi:hypothetical protein HYPSUDRAFT_201710 [Hypholoma sublateritium FD-334 SS-4]|uniref:Uncharacterized protein n=1 Tax=Hypholoma sublateritium (strain FD-334 SS-4) TaxID=945553 RepID=A0A0D2PU72_HYPSF|nr:hypothetical protein HYPSUDRAFT_201710 [Hypholoma sublateritium FD-334 SS-4]